MNRFIEALGLDDSEKQRILANMCESINPPRFKGLSPKRSKLLVCLELAASVFEADREYTEKEINDLLSPMWHDYVTLRRALVDYSFLTRTPDCRIYRLA